MVKKDKKLLWTTNSQKHKRYKDDSSQSSSSGAKYRKNTSDDRKRNERGDAPGEPTSLNDESFRKTLQADGSKTIKDMESDGNCLFRSLSDQLYSDGGDKHEKVRNDICNFLEQQEEWISEFLLLDDEVRTFSEYVARMKNNGEWGGHVEIECAARLYRRNIRIFSAQSEYMFECGEEKTSRNALLLSYHENNHYNSVICHQNDIFSRESQLKFHECDFQAQNYHKDMKSETISRDTSCHVKNPKKQRSLTTMKEERQEPVVLTQNFCTTDKDSSIKDGFYRKNESEVSSTITNMLERLDDANFQATCCHELLTLAYDYERKTTISHMGGIEAIICAMNAHINHASVQKEACAVLQHLAHHHDENIITIPSDGGIQAILCSMRNNSHHPEVLEEACKALYSLACDEENKGTVLSEGGITLIIESMKIHRTHDGVQKEACKALRNMAFNNDQNRKSISLEGGIGILIATMKKNVLCADIQIEACKALNNLARNDEIKVQISREGGIQVIIFIMKKYIGNAYVLQEACHTMYTLISIEEPKMELLNKAGLGLILNVLKKHGDSVSVLKEACRILRVLSHNDSTIKVKIARKCCIRKIICYMMEYAENESFQKEACRMLYNLTHNSIQNQISFSGNDYIPNIIDVMKLNRDRVDVLQEACKILNNLDVDEEKRCILMERDCISVLIDCMSCYINNVKFQKEASKLLKNLTSKNTRLEISRKGGTATLAESMVVNKSCATILHNLLEIFYTLSIEKKSRLLISNQNVNRAIISVIEANMSCTQILFKACKILQYMTLERDNCLYITLCNGIKTIVEGIKTHYSKESIQEVACKVLRNLAVDDGKINCSDDGIYRVTLDNICVEASRLNMDPAVCLALSNLVGSVSNAKRIIRIEGGIQAVLSAMNHHIDHPRIQLEACKALSNLATDDENRTIISNEGGIPLIIYAMKNHCMNVDIQKEAWRTLHLLNSSNSEDQSIISSEVVLKQ